MGVCVAWVRARYGTRRPEETLPHNPPSAMADMTNSGAVQPILYRAPKASPAAQRNKRGQKANRMVMCKETYFLA